MDSRFARKALHDHLRAVLVAEQAKRDERRDWVRRGDGYNETQWMRAEREAMWRAINEQRFTRGAPSGVPITAVEQVENFASGHSDYTDKFALHCAQLVLGERDRETGLVNVEARR